MKKTLLLLIIVAFALSGCVLAGGDKTKDIGLEQARVVAANFINNNLVQPGATVSIKEVTDEGGLYKIVVNLADGQEVVSYLSKDGEKFFPQAYDIKEIESQTQAQEEQSRASQAQELADLVKSEKPLVELFVMSFCPYGVQATNVMSPVAELLGNTADIKLRYIASVEGNDINQVRSLNGAIEGIEGARQLCIAKNYSPEKLWQYVGAINDDCYPIFRQGDEVYRICWQKAARDAGFDVAKLDQCVRSEGPGLIRADDAIAKSYGVTGSPTLIINGSRINPARTPEGYKAAVCAAFTEAPEECVQVLSFEGGAAAGGCE